MRYFVFLTFLLVGCSDLLTENVSDQVEFYENDISLEVYFCPLDDCDGVIKNVIDNAESSVHE